MDNALAAIHGLGTELPSGNALVATLLYNTRRRSIGGKILSCC